MFFFAVLDIKVHLLGSSQAFFDRIWGQSCCRTLFKLNFVELCKQKRKQIFNILNTMQSHFCRNYWSFFLFINLTHLSRYYSSNVYFVRLLLSFAICAANQCRKKKHLFICKRTVLRTMQIQNLSISLS